MFKVDNKNTRTRQWRCFGVFIVNFEHTYISTYTIRQKSKLQSKEQCKRSK